MSDLIDTTEMYLRTIFELEEEGIVPLRARIAERLHQSGPTVSQTVARMERDNLVRVQGDRHLELSEEGRARATRVMRKHRLAERLLIDVIGLDWELVHDEACRWEHVISEDVERKLVDLLHAPTESPYGNPIPGMDELGVNRPEIEFRAGNEHLDAVVRDSGDGSISVIIHRMSEEIQKDVEMMGTLRQAGIQPGVQVLAESGGLAAGADQDALVGPRDGDRPAGEGADAAEEAHQLLVLLHLLGDPLHVDQLVGRPRSGRERLDVGHEVLAVGVAELVEPRDRVAVGRLGRVVEQLEEPALDGLRHHVLPAARFGVDELPVEADDVGQQPLGEPVLAHHAGGQELPLVGELEVAVALHGEQPVALHPGHGLRHRGA